MPGSELRIDRVSRSSRNRFTSVRLDRLVEIRDQPDKLAELTDSPRAHYVPLWKDRCLIGRNEQGQKAIYLHADEWARINKGNKIVPTLLGSDEKRYYLAVSVNEGQKKILEQDSAAGAFRDLRLASLDMDAKHAGVLAYAKALLYWQHRHRFCGTCGHSNRLEAAGHRLVCSNEDCARQWFPRIDPAIIVLVTQGDACLLGRAPSWPEKRYSTLAGFVEPGESLEDAVVREVHEETGVRLNELRYVSSQPWPFPASAMCGFYAEAQERTFRASDEIEDARWFTAETLEQAVRSREVLLPFPVSISFRLVADWYREQCGRSLGELARSL